MKRFPFIAMLGLCPFMAFSQQLPEQAHPSIWYINKMPGDAAVVLFKKDSARVQKDNDILTFAVTQQPNATRLKDTQVNARVLQLLGVDAEAINQQYGPDKQNLLPTEKLLTVAQKLPDHKLLLVPDSGSNQVTAVADSTVAAQPFAEEEPVDNSKSMLDGSNPWLYAIAALVIGFILGWLLKPRKKQETALYTAPMPETTIAPIPAPDEALQQKLTHLEEQLSLGQQELTRLNTEDKRYFNAVFEQLLMPMQESLEQNKRGHLVAQLVTATVLLNSLTRHKLGKKGKYDEANLTLLTGVAGGGADAPVLTGATPPDQIPHHLRGLIELLKEHGVSGLGDLVVQGYRIKDL